MTGPLFPCTYRWQTERKISNWGVEKEDLSSHGTSLCKHEVKDRDENLIQQKKFSKDLNLFFIQ